MGFYIAIGVGVWLLSGAAFFERGRKHRDNELAREWHNARCPECGAEPRPILRHVTGCEAGWPDPKLLKLPGE
jgi:hypothetical protein